MDLTKEEIQIIINLLQQISLPISQAPTVLNIIDKLKFSITPISPNLPKVQQEETT